MGIQLLSCVYFSPTGTTKTIIERIASGIYPERIKLLDITKPSTQKLQAMAFSDEMVIIATPVYYGRVPEVVAERLSALTAEQTPIEPVNLNRIKHARSVVALTPETDTSLCSQCGDCVDACPTEAISPDDVTQTDRWKCLICYACIRCCPESARQMNEPNFQAAVQMLFNMCRDRKEPETFL